MIPPSFRFLFRFPNFITNFQPFGGIPGLGRIPGLPGAPGIPGFGNPTITLPLSPPPERIPVPVPVPVPARPGSPLHVVKPPTYG